MLSALSDTTGRSVDEMGSYLDATQGYIDSLSGIGDSLNPLADSIGNVEESMGTLSSTASEADKNLSNAADSVDNVNSSLGETASTTSTVATNVGTVVDGLNQMPESGKVSGLAGEFKTLAEKIGEVAKALGIGEGEAVSTLFQAMSDLNTVTLGSESEGIIGQFTLLKQAILDVIETIGSSEAQTIGSLMASIAQLNFITLDESIIKQFTSLKTAIDSVTEAISGGGGESSDGESSGKGGTSGGKGVGSKGNGESGGGNSLTGAIESMGDTAKKVIGESDAEGDGIIGRFEEFENVIGEAEGHVQGISKGLDSINGKEVECTIKINIIRNESGGGGGDSAAGESQLLGSMNLDSATYNAKYKGNAHVSGTANVTGNWGVRNPGKTLVGEMGQELWVHAKDSTFETVGDNGAEFITTESGDLIFNHLQTKELLSKGNIVGRGRALASGTALANGTAHSAGDRVTILEDGTVLRPLQPGDPMYDMVQKFDAYFNSIDGNLEKLVPNSFYDHQKQMENMVKQITNNSIVNNTRNVQQPVVHQQFNITMPNVTDSTSAATLMNDLQSLATKKYQVNW